MTSGQVDRNGRNERSALEQLDRTHRRLEKRLEALVDAAAAMAHDGGGEGGHDAVREVCEFLRRAYPRHVADEEQSLFPRLRAHPDVTPALTELMGRIEREHQEHDALLA
jgi:iron-sulfur cluster repair protein YtfE (RIC family)